MPGFWEQDAVKAAAKSADYASLKVVGDKVEGEIYRLSMRKFNEGTPTERSAIEIKFTEGPALTAGQTMLKQGLFELQPEKGDNLLVELGEVQRLGEKTMKRFRIVVTRPSGEVLQVDQRQSATDTGVTVLSEALPVPPTTKPKTTKAAPAAADDAPPF